MKRKPTLLIQLLFVLGCVCATTPGHTQANPPEGPISKEQVLSAWNRMADMVIGSTEKMPAEHFTFSPIEPLAS